MTRSSHSMPSPLSRFVQEPLQQWETSWNLGDAVGQSATLTAVEDGLLAQPQGSSTYAVISAPGAPALPPNGGSSTFGILGLAPAAGLFTGNASAIYNLTVNGEQCMAAPPAATDGSAASGKVHSQNMHSFLSNDAAVMSDKPTLACETGFSSIADDIGCLQDASNKCGVGGAAENGTNIPYCQQTFCCGLMDAAPVVTVCHLPHMHHGINIHVPSISRAHFTRIHTSHFNYCVAWTGACSSSFCSHDPGRAGPKCNGCRHDRSRACTSAAAALLCTLAGTADSCCSSAGAGCRAADWTSNLPCWLPRQRLVDAHGSRRLAWNAPELTADHCHHRGCQHYWCGAACRGGCVQMPKLP